MAVSKYGPFVIGVLSILSQFKRVCYRDEKGLLLFDIRNIDRQTCCERLLEGIKRLPDASGDTMID
ncbi:hypothetical protein KIN20_026187 [Parelaphostrongylus tenuis]|uniref:Uncharacterized protein n=1 Tax=Parelaphostrongylus tenuis TaxID=148309 RepID=A0AAD5MWD1_PARTN|nr:hypothetical protein KIN20_026187 [Parelaphostrongylus tenuis]